MDTVLVTLACYLLAFPFVMAQKNEETLTTPDINQTHTSTMALPTNATGQVTHMSNSTALSNTTRDGGTIGPSSAATAESTDQPRTSNSTATTATTPRAATASSTQTAAGPTSSAASTAVSHTVDRWTGSTGRSTQALEGLGLNISEKSMTIVFSSVLGVLGLAVVVFMFLKCRHKIQYLHQPLNSTGDPDEFAADDDTLVISGGLYDGHPIYDNVPPVPADQSQFRLQFLQ